MVDNCLRKLLRVMPYSSFAERAALWWGYRFRPDPSVIKLRSGSLLRITQVDHLQLLLYYLGTFEPQALKVMQEHVRPGSTILDVGANIGLFTIEGANSVGSSGTIIAIEAAPQHAETVRASAELNRMKNVEVHSVAVGSETGEAILTLPSAANYGMFTLGNAMGDERIRVGVRRIDDIVAGRRVDFIKMDIEGSEYNALLGAKETITRGHPAILIELNEPALEACGSSTRKVKELLFSFGYSGKVVGSNRPIDISDVHHCDECIFI